MKNLFTINRVFIYLFLTIVVYSCNDLSGRLGTSESISDSKKRGVFVAEYKSLMNPVIINDSIKFRVKNVWVEKKWRYGNNLSESSKIDGYHMILESNKNDLVGFTIDWTIGIDFKKCWRFCSSNNMMTDFSEIPTDTIIWKVQKGDYLDSVREKKIIGEFKLIKK